jgi:hypothetical protein
MTTNFGVLLRPAQLLSKYAGAIAGFEDAQQRAKADEKADEQAKITALVNTFIRLCRKQIAGMNEEDAIRIANGESARPIVLYQRTWVAFKKHYQHQVAILAQVNDDLNQLGWRAEYGSSGKFRTESWWDPNPTQYIGDDALLLYPFVE